MTTGGDPHFNVLLPSGQQLCFTVQGERGFTFNLIRNDLLVMNAIFTEDKLREEITWISSMGIIVKSPHQKSKPTKLRFDASNKMIYIGNKVTLHAQKVDRLTFAKGKLTIAESVRKKAVKRPEVFVDLEDVGLSFTIKFVKKRHIDLSWNRVKKQPHESHGLIGMYVRL